MLTLHRGTGVRVLAEEGCPLEAGHALVVSSDRIAETGPYEELYARYGEGSRVRQWSGELNPGRYEPDAAGWLEETYHPDPREAGELGEEPITGAALAALEMSETRWGASARRGLQRLLAAGTTALSGEFRHPAVRTAVARSRIQVLHVHPGHPLPPRGLFPSAAADFAVVAEDGTCLATVLDGRIVYRRKQQTRR